METWGSSLKAPTCDRDPEGGVALSYPFKPLIHQRIKVQNKTMPLSAPVCCTLPDYRVKQTTVHCVTACLHSYRNGTRHRLLHILFSACSLLSSETLSCYLPNTLDHVAQHWQPIPRFTLPFICLFTALLLSISAHLLQDSCFPFLPPSGYPFECL